MFMRLASWLGISAMSDLSDPIKAVGDLYTTDKARLDGEAKLQEEVNKPILSQISVNAILAASNQLFVSGWIPCLGWTAGFLILLYYAPQIIIITVVWGFDCIDTGVITQFPMRPDDILNLVYLLLGFGVHSVLKSKV
jgi:hypothetical protein